MLTAFGRGVARFDLCHANKANKGVMFRKVRSICTDEMQESMQCKTKPIICH